MSELSNCHKATAIVRGDSFGEGTNHYECTACGEACDLYVSETPSTDGRELREGLCEICGDEYPTPWYAPNEVWNSFMRHPDGREASEKYGFVCPNCFIKTAQKLGYKSAWVVTTERHNIRDLLAQERQIFARELLLEAKHMDDFKDNVEAVDVRVIKKKAGLI